MASYYVLTPPGMTNPEKQVLFIRDGFSWPAFFFSMPWLLVKKLWLHAALAVIFYLIAVIIAEYSGLDGLPIAYSFVLSLWAGFEGGHVRAAWLQRRGWDLQADIAASTLEEAEAVYFGDIPEATPLAPVRGFPGSPVHHPSQTVALGLIGPYGSR